MRNGVLWYLGMRRKLTFVTVLHGLACAISFLLAMYYFLRCCIGISLALDDLRLYKALGFSHNLWYFLKEYHFQYDLFSLIIVAAELLLYVTLYRKSLDGKAGWMGALILGILAAVHILIWVHACHLDLPSIPVKNEVEERILLYFYFARNARLHPLLCLLAYIVRMWKNRKSKVNT